MIDPGMPVVTVFGASDPVPGSAAWDDAFEVGRLLAGAGYWVANGGYGGTMEASAKGASEAGGEIIGVTCSLWTASPNSYVDHVVCTKSHGERLDQLVCLGTCGYVVLPGATGTLVELATVWELAAKGFLPKGPKGRSRPIACVGEFWNPLVDLMASAKESSRDIVTLCAVPGDIRDVFGKM